MAKLLTKILISTSLVALASLHATAQQNPPAEVGVPTPAPPANRSASLDTGQFVTTSRPHQWRATKLIGLDVLGADNEKVGDVTEILIDPEGNEVVVVSIGGFLGVAGREVALPFRAVEWRYGERSKTPETLTPTPPTSSDVTSRKTIDTTQRGYPDFAVIRTTRNDLKAAPEFRYSRD
jgi:sporulation protein YlmC with PRC-barrel domain